MSTTENPARHLGAFDGQRKSVAAFNPFFPDMVLRRECNRIVETHHWLKDVAGLAALALAFTGFAFWTGVF